jgi:hypothetical protein
MGDPSFKAVVPIRYHDVVQTPPFYRLSRLSRHLRVEFTARLRAPNNKLLIALRQP